MTQTGLECLFLEIMYVFRILNFGSACGGLFAWYLIFVIWNFRLRRVGVFEVTYMSQ